MIGKEKFFDIISRTAEDTNKADITTEEILLNFMRREEKYNKQIKE